MRSHGEDGGLARVEDRHAGVDPEDADVGQRDGAAVQVVRRAARGAGAVGQVRQRRDQFTQRQVLRLLDVRHDQAEGPATAMPRLT